MAGASVKVHLISNMTYKPLEQLIGFFGDDIKAMVNAGDNGQKPKLYGLAFDDPDGEAHIFVMTDDGKQNLIRKLTGGLVVPTG